MLRTIALAASIAGTLDIVAAFIIAGIAGSAPVRVLQAIAAGLVDSLAQTSTVFALLGLLIHYAIAACMAAAYVLAATRIDLLTRRPILMGGLYGALLWAIMYQLVLPLRWPEIGAGWGLLDMAIQLVVHILLVGIPIALVTTRGRRETAFG